VDGAALAQAVATHPVESVLTVASIGLMTLLGQMLRSRLQAIVDIIVLLLGTVTRRERR
jgi:hypothetical protein